MFPRRIKKLPIKKTFQDLIMGISVKKANKKSNRYAEAAVHAGIKFSLILSITKEFVFKRTGFKKNKEE